MALAMFGFGAAASADVAYVRGQFQPWGQVTNEAAMDLAFGIGAWLDTTMAADNGAVFAPGSGYRFVFLEGSDDDAVELAAYLNAHRAAIEAWVNGGGRLLLNSAPNEPVGGGNIDFGFGGVTLMYDDVNFADTVDAADPAHPIFNGPNAVGVTQFTGNSFGHSSIADTTGHVMPLIVGAVGDQREGETILGEMRFGRGLVLFGGMTTDNFHQPQPDAANLRANILDYSYNTSVGPGPDDDPVCGNLIPVGSPYAGWALAIVPLMLAGVWLVRRRA